MNARPRIDLDGVALHDERNADMIVAIFRYRTTEGLLMLIPESADVLVPWNAIEGATLDLVTGAIEVRLSESYVTNENWVRGARVLSGKWLDRYTMQV